MGAKKEVGHGNKTPKVYYETLKFIKLRLVWETLKWVAKRRLDMQNEIATNYTVYALLQQLHRVGGV
jgi:hypothetical protein